MELVLILWLPGHFAILRKLIAFFAKASSIGLRLNKLFLGIQIEIYYDPGQRYSANGDKSPVLYELE